MNNRFKFRLWSIEEKKFICPNILEVWDDSGELTPFEYVKTGKLSPMYMPVENYIIQQYTGLNDKNGKEIYEGDIVQYNQNSSYDNMDFIAKWSDDKLGFIFQSNSGDELLNQTPHLNRFKHLEVVGNIFENKKIFFIQASAQILKIFVF